MALKKLNFTAKIINADICSNLAVTASFEMSKYSLGSVYTWVLEKNWDKIYQQKYGALSGHENKSTILDKYFNFILISMSFNNN